MTNSFHNPFLECTWRVSFKGNHKKTYTFIKNRSLLLFVIAIRIVKPPVIFSANMANEELVQQMPVNLSNEQALELVGRFLHKEWKFLRREDVTVTRIQ